MNERLARACVALGVGALACSIFTLPSDTQFRLVRLEGPGLAVLVITALLAIVGGRLRQRGIVLVAGAVLLAAAVLQLVQLGGSSTLRGDGSTFALFLGLSVGLLVLALLRNPIPPAASDADTAHGRAS